MVVSTLRQVATGLGEEEETARLWVDDGDDVGDDAVLRDETPVGDEATVDEPRDVRSRRARDRTPDRDATALGSTHHLLRLGRHRCTRQLLTVYAYALRVEFTHS